MAYLDYQSVIDNIREQNPNLSRRIPDDDLLYKYVYKNDEYEGDINNESGAVLKDNAILGSLPENTYVYDITTGNFIYRQGKRVFKLDLDVKEE